MPTCSRPVTRTFALALGAALAGVLPLAPEAAADVTISPTTAVQGDAASVTFHVQNQRGRARTTRVEVDLPPDTPIAEVYPMTVPYWAPRIIMREVKDPLPGLHGSALTEATSAVIWERASDAPAPPAVETLRLEMGPMPETDRLVFTVVQTYSDGTVQRWNGPAAGSPAAGSPAAGSPAAEGSGTVLVLTPATAGAQGAHGHGSQQSPAAAGASPAGPADLPAVSPVAAAGSVATSAASGSTGMNLIDVGVGGGLAVGVVIVVLLAARGSTRRPESDPV
jgi:uncharacterized protein YcnI